jgi:hypothetical protein
MSWYYYVVDEYYKSMDDPLSLFMSMRPMP